MITVTEAAKTQLNEILLDEPTAKFVRAFISGGGCSGFNYGFTLEEGKEEDKGKEEGTTPFVGSVFKENNHDCLATSLASSDISISLFKTSNGNFCISLTIALY